MRLLAGKNDPQHLMLIFSGTTALSITATGDQFIPRCKLTCKIVTQIQQNCYGDYKDKPTGDDFDMKRKSQQTFIVVMHQAT